MPKKKRLIWQLYPYFLLIILISIFAVTWYASRSLRHFFLEQIRSDLEARVTIFEKQVLRHLNPLDQKALDALCKQIGQTAATRFTIILPSGKVVGDTHEDPLKMDNHADRPEIIRAVKEEKGYSVRYSRTIGKNLMYVALSRKQNPLNGVVVRASIPIDPVDQAIQDVQMKIILGAFIIAALGAVVSYLVSRRITKPIKEIQIGAECFSEGDFECRLPISDIEEIGSLSETMNQMAGDLQGRINTIMRQRNQFEAVLSGMVEGVIAVDLDERVILMNQAAGKILRQDTARVEGRSIQEVARNTDLQSFVKVTISSNELLEREIIVYSNTEQILNAHGTILKDEAGKRMGALVVLNDVTRLKKLEDMRRDFVANVSHEIKTPITAIKGFSETLRDGAIQNPEDAERFLGIIDRHVNRLESIIEDLLSLSKIEQEEEENQIQLDEGDVKPVLETAVQLCNAKAKEKNIHLLLECADSVSAHINPALLEQAVVNLLDNAIKYSPEGGEIRLSSMKKVDEIQIMVKDRGCGIEKDQQSRIFERFYRVDRARSRDLGGTGLGLAIVKHIAQAHGGRVAVESMPGKGSAFSISLPRAERPAR